MIGSGRNGDRFRYVNDHNFDDCYFYLAITPFTQVGDTVHVFRRSYKRVIDEVKSVRSRCQLPLEPALTERMRKLGAGKEWVMNSHSYGRTSDQSG